MSAEVMFPILVIAIVAFALFAKWRTEHWERVVGSEKTASKRNRKHNRYRKHCN